MLTYLIVLYGDPSDDAIFALKGSLFSSMPTKLVNLHILGNKKVEDKEALNTKPTWPRRKIETLIERERQRYSSKRLLVVQKDVPGVKNELPYLLI